jgi:topoisomerase IV subunit B
MPEAPGEWATTTHDWSSSGDPDHIRFVKRHAGRYGSGGALHLLLEVIAYADDEAREQGRTGHCHVALAADGSIRVDDDGRGTDTRIGPNGEPVRKPIMSTKDVRFFDVEPPVLLPDGLPRRGISVVSALSDWLHHCNRRADGAWEQRYDHGRPCSQLLEVTQPVTYTGTTVAFRLDPALVPASRLTADLVRGAARFSSLTIHCTVEDSSPRA